MDVANEHLCLDNLLIIFVDLMVDLYRPAEQRHTCGQTCKQIQGSDLKELKQSAGMYLSAVESAVPLDASAKRTKAVLLYQRFLRQLGELATPDTIIEKGWFKRVARASSPWADYEPKNDVKFGIDAEFYEILKKFRDRIHFADIAMTEYLPAAHNAVSTWLLKEEKEAKRIASEEETPSKMSSPEPDSPYQSMDGTEEPSDSADDEPSEDERWSEDRAADTWWWYEDKWFNEVKIRVLQEHTSATGDIVCHCEPQVTARLELAYRLEDGEMWTEDESMNEADFPCREDLYFTCRKDECTFGFELSIAYAIFRFLNFRKGASKSRWQSFKEECRIKWEQERETARRQWEEGRWPNTEQIDQEE